jgi:hypothetical protein
VECGIFGHNFCKKYFGPAEASHVLRNAMSFASVNILCNISNCFIAHVYMDCLVFLRRLKCGSPWLNELARLLQRHPLLFGHLRLRRKDEVLVLHRKLVFYGLPVQLVLEVTDEGPQKSKPIWFC